MERVYLLLPLAVAGMASGLILLVLRARPQSSMHRLFLLTLVAVGMWGFTIYGMRSSSTLEQALRWEKGALAAILCLPLFAYHFTCLFTGRAGNRVLLRSFYIVAAILLGLIVIGQVVPEMERKWYGYAPLIGPIFPAYLLFEYLLSGLSINNLVRHLLKLPMQGERNRTMYVLLGVVSLVVGGTTDYLPALGLRVYPTGIVGTVLFCCLVSVALLKHNLLDVRRVLKTGLVYSIVSSLVLGVYVGVVWILNGLLLNRAPSFSWPINLIAMLTVAVLLKSLLDRVQGVVDKWFRRQSQNYLQALEHLGRETKDITDLAEVARGLKRATSQAMGQSAVWLLIPSHDGSFVSVDHLMSNATHRALKLNRTSHILAWLNSREQAVTLDDVNISPTLQALPATERQQLADFDIRLLVPLKARGSLAGVLVLGKKVFGAEYSEEDRTMLQSVANQMALTIENARLFAQVNQQRQRVELLLEQVMEAQEGERKRLSLELHDSSVQWLTSSVYRLEACIGYLRHGHLEPLEEELAKIQELNDRALGDLRRAITDLHPPELETVGLEAALIRYVDAFERETGIICDFQSNWPAFPLSQSIRIVLYRVVQEALSNVRKHSGASQVRIILKNETDGIVVLIHDNGNGFDVVKAKGRPDGHLGLAGMEERARMVGGSLTIKSKKGGGTRIKLKVPCNSVPESMNHQDLASSLSTDHSRATEVAL